MHKPLVVAFYYGFCEGPWHSMRFRRLLKIRGFTLTKDASEANIIVSHSAGSYFVPELQQDQILFMINPTYWPGKKIMPRASKKIRQDLVLMAHPSSFFFTFRKFVHNVVYGIIQPMRCKTIITRAHSFDLAEELHHKKSILIRNGNDPWLTPDLSTFAAKNPTVKIHHVEGDHDHCWRKPKVYVDIIQKTLGR